MHFLKKLIQITDIGARIYNLSCLMVVFKYFDNKCFMVCRSRVSKRNIFRLLTICPESFSFFSQTRKMYNRL